jgi:hypothetical protein
MRRDGPRQNRHLTGVGHHHWDIQGLACEEAGRSRSEYAEPLPDPWLQAHAEAIPNGITERMEIRWERDIYGFVPRIEVGRMGGITAEPAD